jgi:hypothetical protein
MPTTKRKATAKKKPAPKKRTASTKELVSLKQMCIEADIDPKSARAKLRKEGHSANGGRYDDLERGSKKFLEFEEIISA